MAAHQLAFELISTKKVFQGGKASFLFFPFTSVLEIITEHLYNAPSSPWVGESLQLF